MSTEASFAEVIKQVELIVDVIITNLKNGYENTQAEENLMFKQHLVTTSYWFCRISSANKKRFLLALLKDIRSAAALSLLLKSIWNYRPKDALLSICGLKPEHDSSWPHADSTSKKSRRFSLWSHDFSRLYPAFKIASYQSPM